MEVAHDARNRQGIFRAPVPPSLFNLTTRVRLSRCVQLVGLGFRARLSFPDLFNLTIWFGLSRYRVIVLLGLVNLSFRDPPKLVTLWSDARWVQKIV